jgi:phosphatidylinositol alpha 1,6-mannosyltransferase
LIAGPKAVAGLRRVHSYVALGDSFTAGTGCGPGEAWADRIAAGLAHDGAPLTYSNLAVDGATSADVLMQLDNAVELRPELATVICGANDVLLTVRPDLEGFGERLGQIFDLLRGAAADPLIVTATYPGAWHFLGAGPRTAARIEAGIAEVNAVIRDRAYERGIHCIDVAEHPRLRERENFAADGLHPSALGHAVAAREISAVLRHVLGIDCEFEETS